MVRDGASRSTDGGWIYSPISLCTPRSPSSPFFHYSSTTLLFPFFKTLHFVLPRVLLAPCWSVSNHWSGEATRLLDCLLPSVLPCSFSASLLSALRLLPISPESESESARILDLRPKTSTAFFWQWRKGRDLPPDSCCSALLGIIWGRKKGGDGNGKKRKRARERGSAVMFRVLLLLNG